MEKVLLITRPDHDPVTHYLSRWSLRIIDEAKRKNIYIIDLEREKAVRQRVIGTLQKTNPQLVVLNGHGNEHVVTGHNDEIILQHEDKKAVISKIIFARSCRAARVLGKTSVAQGAVAFLGYQEDFWLVYEDRKISQPLDDKTAALFLEPSNYIAISLLKGHSTGEANERSKDLFRKNIQKLMVRGDSEDLTMAKYLYWDMINQVCLGSQTAAI